MVGIVIVSHSRELADSIVEFTKMMAPEALIRAAGGMDDGTLGTSYETGNRGRLFRRRSACDDGHGQCCYDNRDGSGGDV